MGRQSNVFSALLLCATLASEASFCAIKNTTRPIPKIRRNYGGVADADDNDNSGASLSQPRSSVWQQPQPSNKLLQPSSQAPSQPTWRQQPQPTQEWVQPQPQHKQGWEQRQPTQGWEQRQPTHGWEQRQPTQGWEQRQPTHGWEQRQPTHGWEQRQPTHGWEQRQPTHGWEQRQPTHGWEQRQPTQGWEQRQPMQEWKQPRPSSQLPTWSSSGNRWQPNSQSQHPSWNNQQPSWSNQQPSSIGWMTSLKRRQFVVNDFLEEQQPTGIVILHQAVIAVDGAVIDKNGQQVPFAGVGYIDSNGVIHFHRLADGPASQLPQFTASSFQNRTMFRDNGDDNLDDNQPQRYIEGEAVKIGGATAVLPNGDTIPFDGVGTINGTGVLNFHQIVDTQNGDESSPPSKLLRRQSSVSSGAVQVDYPVTIFNEDFVDENGTSVQFDGLCYVDKNNLLYYYPLDMFSDASNEKTQVNVTSEVLSRHKRQIDIDDFINVDDDNSTTPTGYVFGQLNRCVSGPNGESLIFSGIGSVDANGVLFYHPLIGVVDVSDMKRVRRQGVPQSSGVSQLQSVPLQPALVQQDTSQQSQPATASLQPAPQQSQPQIQVDVVNDSDEEGDDWQQFNMYQPQQQQQQQKQELLPQQQNYYSADSGVDSDLNDDSQQPQEVHQPARVDPNAPLSSSVPDVDAAVEKAASDIDDSDENASDEWKHDGHFA